MSRRPTRWSPVSSVFGDRTPLRRCFPSLDEIEVRARGARSAGRRAAFRFRGQSLRFTDAGWTHLGRPLAALVAEQELGRPLRATEAVRHKDGNVWDASPENVEVVPR